MYFIDRYQIGIIKINHLFYKPTIYKNGFWSFFVLFFLTKIKLYTNLSYRNKNNLYKITCIKQEMKCDFI